MRTIYPDFGKGCYVDSTPLPNEIKNNPLNALCRHGKEGAVNQTRLVFILDKGTGRIVWYIPIPGNINDINTLKNVTADVSASLNITIDSFVLDAGYISKDLIASMCSEKGKDFIGRMPNRKGFHYSTLFTQQVRPYITKFNNYQFFRARHTYFGKKIREKFFGYDLNAYVYVDKENAANYNKEYHIIHPELIQKMDESQLSWIAYRGGYFVLLSNLMLLLVKF